jgi:glutamate/tyrosine decarboxylase-like PLP-dependent enzyme
MEYSVHTSHPRFLDKLFTGVDPMNMYSEMVVGLLNANIHTYAASAINSVIEVNCINELGKMAGYKEGKIDGLFVPGGSYANMVALMVARNEAFPHVRQEGWKSGDNPVILMSTQAHYSVDRAAMMAGVGMNNCVKIKASLNGCMDIEDLEI